MQDDAQLVFVPLGGLREIGMNCALYGFGPKRRRKWLMVDLGLAFAGDEAPGVDLVMPDLAFVQEIKRDLVGIVITHAHEDHIGALAELWPSLGAPVYMTRFAAGPRRSAPPRRARRAENSDPRRSARRPCRDRPVRGRIHFGRAFDSRKRGARHPHARRASSFTPATGRSTRTRASAVAPTRRACGRSATKACWRSICDSTNVVREGESPSEADVARTLHELVSESKARVIVTTFASNVARLRSAAEAGLAAGRQVLVMGRAMERVIAVARECGYLDGLPPFLGPDPFDRLPRDKVLALATGSQGEPRAALARMAEEEHSRASLAPGDRVIFSSRTIPGNEKAVGRVVNGLVEQDVAGRSPTARISCMSPAIRAAPSSRACTNGRGRRSPCPRMANRCI